MLRAAALIASLVLSAPDAMTPRLSADLDGDEAPEIVTATAKRGAVRLQVIGGANGKKADAKAPAPAADVVRVALTAAPLGSVGSLLEVVAATDESACVSIWRFREGTLTRIPIRDAAGRNVPDCEPPSQVTYRWERPDPQAPSILIRETVHVVERGKLRRQETYAFAGFSLDSDPQRLTVDVDGVQIPSWYPARLYTRAALDQLYSRFDLSRVRTAPQLEILTDPERGTLALRLISGGSETLVPVESFSQDPKEQTATLTGRSGDREISAKVQLAGLNNVPMEVELKGFGAAFDNVFSPAESHRGNAREVFSSAADEIASRFLEGTWTVPKAGPVRMQTDGAPPYKLLVDQQRFVPDFDHAAEKTDLTLLPTDRSRKGWGLVLRGPNALDRVPMLCDAADAGTACRAQGPAERLRRMGARINVN